MAKLLWYLTALTLTLAAGLAIGLARGRIDD